MRPAPAWLRLLGGVMRRSWRAQYWVVARMAGHSAAFEARLHPEAGGAAFACDFGDAIAREAYLTGWYEPPVTRLVRACLRPGGSMVDAGANWGYFTLVAASSVGAGGRVVSFEPDPRAFEQLTRNVELNRFSHVVTHGAAVGAAEGAAVLAGYVDLADNRGVSRIGAQRPAGPVFDVTCVSLDEVLPEAPHDVVKIDVEGAEYDVLLGMMRGLERARYGAIVLELHPPVLAERGQSADDCIRLLRECGYIGHTIDVSPAAYREAQQPRRHPSDYLLDLDAWQRSNWPHTFWLAPGRQL